MGLDAEGLKFTNKIGVQVIPQKDHQRRKMCRNSPLLCADAGCERWCKQLSPGGMRILGTTLFFGKDDVKHNRLLCGFNGFLICPPLLGEVLIRVLVVNMCFSYVCYKFSVVFYRGQPPC